MSYRWLVYADILMDDGSVCSHVSVGSKKTLPLAQGYGKDLMRQGQASHFYIYDQQVILQRGYQSIGEASKMATIPVKKGANNGYY